MTLAPVTDDAPAAPAVPPALPGAAIQDLRARITGHDADAIAIQRLVEKHGFFLDERRNGGANACSCAHALITIYERSAQELDDVFALCRATWPEKEASASEIIINGVSMFLRRYGHLYDRRRFVNKMGVLDPLYLKAKAAEGQQLRKGFSAEKLLVETFVDYYDEHLRSGRLRKPQD